MENMRIRSWKREKAAAGSGTQLQETVHRIRNPGELVEYDFSPSSPSSILTPKAAKPAAELVSSGPRTVAPQHAATRGLPLPLNVKSVLSSPSLAMRDEWDDQEQLELLSDKPKTVDKYTTAYDSLGIVLRQGNWRPLESDEMAASLPRTANNTHAPMMGFTDSIAVEQGHAAFSGAIGAPSVDGNAAHFDFRASGGNGFRMKIVGDGPGAEDALHGTWNSTQHMSPIEPRLDTDELKQTMHEATKNATRVMSQTN